MQHAIRAKLRRLASQQQRLREEVLQERELLTQVGGCNPGLPRVRRSHKVQLPYHAPAACAQLLLWW